MVIHIVQDKDITLGVGDVYAIRGIYEGGNDIILQVVEHYQQTQYHHHLHILLMHLLNDNALSDGGTEVVGSVSGARGILIENANENSGTNVCYFYYKEKFSTISKWRRYNIWFKIWNNCKFTKGSKNITITILLDDGQRDGFYGIGKITRKESAPQKNPIMVVFDYFTHAGGNHFKGVSSYPSFGSNGALSIEEIPSL